MTTGDSEQQQQEEDKASWQPVRIRTVDPRAVEYESVDPGHFLGCRVAYFSFRAKHIGTGRPCYVNREFYRHRDNAGEISPEGLAILRRVEREASVLCALAQSDRVQGLVDAFRDDSWIWRVYESSASREDRWHDANALRQLLPSGASIAVEVRSVMRQLLSALGHCHSREIVHGHVRPKSILLIPRTTNANRECSEKEGGGGRFDVKLFNFEFAHRFGDSERYPPNRHFPASPCYDYDAPELLLLAEAEEGMETTTAARTSSPTSSSPLLPSNPNEFTTKNKYDSDAAIATATTTAESDMWAAGATFFELVAGRPLFPGISQIDALFRIFRQLGTPYDGGTDRNEIDDDGNPRLDVAANNRWPGVSDLPHYDPRVFPDWRRRGPLPWPEEARRELDADGLALLSDLMCLDPQRRIAAGDTSDHSYFSTPRNKSD